MVDTFELMSMEKKEQPCASALKEMDKDLRGSQPFLPPDLSTNSSLLSDDLDSSADSSGLGTSALSSADNEGRI